MYILVIILNEFFSVLSKIDDDMVALYQNEDAYIIQITQPEATSQFTVTLIEVDVGIEQLHANGSHQSINHQSAPHSA